MKELAKVYDPSIEERIYNNWLDNNYFHAEVDKNKIPYTIVIPPPNITGQLHMGHALDNTYQDILIRFKRMQGFNALWVPGCDHASIATEAKIVEKMTKDGLKKSDIGREAFLERAWEWKEQYGANIINQLKKIGCSCDWARERFTMDSGLSAAVTHVFVNLYNKGLIYRGEKLINWCPKCKTTISDAEVNHVEQGGHFWHIKYPLKDSDDYLQIATTRPETMLGDTAIAVHPDDERYQKYIGKTVILPIVEKEIPVIADEYVDKEFGTGVVKITPGHDFNDFEVGERHNLPIINIMNDDGTLNENTGKYSGCDKYVAREKIVSELQEKGLLVKIEDINHAVGVHERCNDIVEPLLKRQWFVKMEELAKPAIDVYKNGELNFIPDRFGKIYLNWLYNIKDWCISRQLWWGHRIPAYHCADCFYIEVSECKPTHCPKCNSEKITQDNDILDTWFSSALWPFATLGWPEDTEEYKHFFPTNVLVTGYDIIFFWVIRMVFSSLEHTKQIPFKDVLIHGLMRDSQGRKMSKSLGNGVDPLEIIDKYGADALRFTVVTGNAPGNDMRFYWERIEASRNFANKLWNASRFVLMNMSHDFDFNSNPSFLTAADKWILNKVNTLIKETTDNMENYELGIAVQKIFDFIWDEFCDWFIEMVKPRLYNKDDETRSAALWTLSTVLINSLKLLHPYMPFVTEELFTHFNTGEKTIMLSSWPTFKEEWSFNQEEHEIELIKEAVRKIRNIRTEMNVPPSKLVKVFIVSNDEEVKNIFSHSKVFFQTLSYASDVIIDDNYDDTIGDSVSLVIPSAVIYMPTSELVDIEKEKQRLKLQRDKLISEVERVDKKLNNKGFMSKAPEAVINDEKEKQLKYHQMLEQVEKNLAKILEN